MPRLPKQEKAKQKTPSEIARILAEMPTAPVGVTVSFSELDAFRQCPLRWWLGYNQRWSKAPKLDSALGKGTLWHLVLEHHYKKLMALRPNGEPVEPEDLELALVREHVIPRLLLAEGSGEWRSEVHELIGWMYDGYCEQWGTDRGWRILAVEHAPVITIRTPSGAPSRYKIKARIDLIVQDIEFDGRIWVVDHKSGQNLPTQKDLDLDDQFGLYLRMLRRLGVPAWAAIYNAARTQRNKAPMALVDRMSRTRLPRQEEELARIEEDAYLTASAAYGRRAITTGGITGRGYYSSPNPDQCKWKCDFKEVHLLARKGEDLERALLGFGFQQSFERH